MDDFFSGGGSSGSSSISAPTGRTPASKARATASPAQASSTFDLDSLHTVHAEAHAGLYEGRSKAQAGGADENEPELRKQLRAQVRRQLPKGFMPTPGHPDSLALSL